MSLKEQTIILTDKDNQGNTIMQFPITKAKNIEDVMSIAQGGTGADNATSALSNLGILGAIVNASVSGRTITFTKKDNTKFSINTQDTNNGIVAALLGQNGYAKFANGLILQWGTSATGTNMNLVHLPITMQNSEYAVLVQNKGTLGYQGFWQVDNCTVNDFRIYNSFPGNGITWFWACIGK